MRKDVIKKLNEFKLDEAEMNDIIERIFGSIKSRKESLIASESVEVFSERTNELLDFLEKHEHPFKNIKLNEWFSKYRLRKIYNSFTKLMWKFKSKTNDYYTTNDIEG